MISEKSCECSEKPKYIFTGAIKNAIKYRDVFGKNFKIVGILGVKTNKEKDKNLRVG